MRTVAIVNNSLGQATDSEVLYDTDYYQQDDAQQIGEAKCTET